MGLQWEFLGHQWDFGASVRKRAKKSMHKLDGPDGILIFFEYFIYKLLVQQAKMSVLQTYSGYGKLMCGTQNELLIYS